MGVKEKYSTGEKWLSLGMAKSLPEAIQNELNVERLLLLHSHKPTTAITMSLISFSNIAFLWQSQNPVYLCFWLVAFQGLALMTLLNWRRNHKKPRPKTIRPGLLNRAITQAVIVGALYGLFTAMYFSTGNQIQQMILSLVLVGIASGSVSALYSLPAAAFICILLCFLPITYVLTLQSEADYSYLIFLVGVFVCYLFFTTRNEFMALLQSHELRTPLNAIIGFSDIMNKELFGPVGNDRYAGYMADINYSGEYLLSLVDDVLDLSRIEADKFEIKKEPVNISRVVESCFSLMSVRAEQAQVKLSSNFPDDLPEIYADERSFRQIIINLISNSIKFTPPEGEIRVSSMVTGFGQIEISVTDSGLGIAEEDIPKVLTTFGQVDSYDNQRGKGCGLGLPLSKALAELQGGRLWITSLLGAGTTVTVSMPLAT